MGAGTYNATDVYYAGSASPTKTAGQSFVVIGGSEYIKSRLRAILETLIVEDKRTELFYITNRGGTMYGLLHGYLERISNYQYLVNMTKLSSQQFSRLLPITNDQPLPILLKKRYRKNNKQNRIKRNGAMVYISDAVKFLVLVLV